MKVHIHTPSFFPSLVGMTYAAHVHATLLRELGADVTVIAPRTEAGRISETIDYDVRHFDVSGSGLPWSRLRGDIDGLLRFNEEEQPDIVIAEGWFTTAAALLPELRASCRHAVLSSHGSADLSLKSPTAAQLFRSLSYRWIEPREHLRIAAVVSAAILLTAYEDMDRFRDGHMFAARGIPTYVCPNPSTYAPAATPAEDRHGHMLLHVGSLTSLKNQLQAVNVLATLPQSFRLTLAYPSWNGYGEEVMGAAKVSGVQDRITLVEGRTREELEPIFDACDLLLITSLTEAQPIIAADALRKAMPFVSTNVGCMSEFGGGIVADRHSIRDAILHIFQDNATYKRYSYEAGLFYDRKLDHRHSQIALSAMLKDLGGK